MHPIRMILVSALLAATPAGVALAGDTPRTPPALAAQGYGPGCVDHDGDGVCDGRGLNRRHAFVDEDGDGVCDATPAGRGPRGRGLNRRYGPVDEDGNRVVSGRGEGNGPRGRGLNRRYGPVDEDGDGACDDCGRGRGRFGRQAPADE
ncbi:MAG: hypothetical protein JXB39_08875 [Deltaproteobacteria bacterium]|nr:hypothetical protein [Deltaproteobacteria bacterium]